MDKYEYNLKLDQMKSLFAEEKYEEAADIADSMNWNKVKNPTALLRAGEIYEKTGRYEDSRDVLLMAYDRSPIGRGIIYRLAEVAVKMQDFQAAQDYYDEFVEIAPHDNLKYVLRYDIKKAQGASYRELIPILEELREQEYTEEWAYELAYLYHKAGMSDKCIDACDELILWFGDGPYVERALELKMLYQPLTKAQEEKYRSFRQAKDGYTHINIEEMQRAGEYAHEPVTIPQVDVNPERFNTVNLQEEIAKGMQQIIDATEKSTVADTLDNINRMVEEIPYLKLPKEETADEGTHIETDEEIDGSLKINFQELLGEDSDGQISLMMDEQAQLERQITGQITIEEVLEEWERTKRAAEAALQEAEQRKLESAKARALQQAGDIMDRLTDVIPKLDAGVTPRELLEEEYLQEKPETAVEAPAPEAVLQTDIEEPADLDMAVDAESIADGVEIISQDELLAADTDSIDDALLEQELLDESELVSDEEPLLLEPEEEQITGEDELLSESEDELNFRESDLLADEEVVAPEEKAEPEEKPAEEASAKKPADEKPKGITERWKAKTLRMPEIKLPEDLDDDDESDETKVIDKLTDEQKKIFSYFIPVKGMEGQLCQALTGVTRHLEKDATARTGNLIIQGGQCCGKTTLATSIIKVLQDGIGRPNDKIGKIQAEALNKKDIGQLLRKVAGGCLIIENAGELSRQSIVTLSLLLEQDNSGILIILEGTSKGIKKALSQDEGFAKKFTEKITVPIFSNDELVAFARSYSKELGYEIDEMAVLALYNRISNIQRLDQDTTLTEVKEIVDEAIEREAHGGMKKYFSILTASRYTDDDRIVLREKDFE
ncbi:MAG: hypothetical protein SPE81_11270 [Agathobacter sp.]|nr:hypothetical protein [Agathobacter sp.]